MPEPIKSNQIPVLNVVVESCLLPLRHVRPFLVSAGLAIGGLATLAAALWLVGGEGLSTTSLVNQPVLMWAFVLTFGLSFLAVLVGIFNLWVRLGVMGDARAWAQPRGSWARQILGNFGNFIWIGILVGLAVMLIMFVFTVVFGGTLVALMPQAIVAAISAQASTATFWVALVLLMIAIPTTWLACYLYAIFSLNIVEGALGENYVSSSLPRDQISGGALRFSIILAGVYLAGELAKLLLLPFAGVMVLEWVAGTIEILIYFYGIAVIGAAHGIVFRLKTGRTGTRGEDIAVASDSAVATTVPTDLQEK